MIRVNLLAPERPTKKAKKSAVSVAPGAVQVYLFLALFAGGFLAGLLSGDLEPFRWSWNPGLSR